MDLLIANNRELMAFLSRIAPLSEVAIDTEADSLHCYFEKLCLIQISTPSESVLIDPLSKIDLTLFFTSLCDKRLVFHGADYDLKLITRCLEFKPKKIFDTMIAARLLGYEGLGLAALVDRFFNVKLSKVSQKANWALRPLPPQMIEYAINDTKFLLDLAKILEAEIIRLGRQEWLSQSVERLIHSIQNPKEKDWSNAWQITGSAVLSPSARAVLRALWYWRDAEAREWNRPSFHVMGNEDMLKIAEASTKGTSFSTPGFPSARRKRFEEALAAALRIPEDQWPVRKKVPRPPRLDRQALQELERLRKLRDEVAKREKLDPAIIASRAALEAVAFQKDSSNLMDWQKRLLFVGESSAK